MSQADKVIAHIEKWGSINSIEAIRSYGITRLARVIHDLKGTPNQMKSVHDDCSAEGFVKYVPDYEARMRNQVHTLQQTLNNPDIAAKYKAVACLEAAHMYTQVSHGGH